MNRGKGGWWRAGWLVALAAVAAGADARPAAARQDPAECRCVDVDGNAIENCTCFRMPDVEAIVTGLAMRPRLGIRVVTDQGTALDAQGVRVASVTRDGPAYEAGIREGDVITRIDGQSLLSPLPGDAEEDFDRDRSLPAQRLLALARDMEAGDDVEIEYLRDDARQTATVEARELAGAFQYSYQFDADQLRDQLRDARDGLRSFRFEPPDLPDVADAPQMRFFQGGGTGPLVFGTLLGARYGLELVELNEALGSYFGTSQGVLVADVEEDSALGVRPGDVILRVGDREATTPDRVTRILGTYGEDEQVTFRVRRNGTEIDVLGRVAR